MGIRYAVLCLLLVSLAVAGDNRIQQNPLQLPQPTDQSSAPNSSPVLKTTTRLVIVDVVATNSKGEPVTDLSARDFKVLEGGKEQDIKIFDFQHPAPAAQTASQGGPPTAPNGAAKLPPNVVNNLPAYKPSSALNVVLLDALNTATPRQSFARDEVIRFLGKMPAGQPVAIYVLGSKLRLVQDFSDDPTVLKKSMETVRTAGSKLLDNPTAGPPMAILNGNLDATPPGIRARIEEMEADGESFTTGERIHRTLDALTLIARNLAGYSGRKNLIWVSDAFPIDVSTQLYLKSESRADLRHYHEQSDKMLMDTQVAIYPIDTHDLQVTTFFDIGFGKPGDVGVNALNAGPMALRSMSQDFNDHLGVHSTMNEVAENTGGQAYYYKNGIEEAIRQGINDGSTYYTIGYYPANKHWDGKFRKIEVKVDRPGVHLHHRVGYYALEPDVFLKQDAQQRAAAFHRALDWNAPVSTALLFQAAVLEPSEKNGNKVAVNFGIDPHGVNFNKDEKGLQHATLECAVEAYSEKGTVVKSEATEVTAALEPSAFDKVSHTFFPCQQTLELPAGNYKLRIGVVDNSTGLMGTANASVTVK